MSRSGRCSRRRTATSWRSCGTPSRTGRSSRSRPTSGRRRPGRPTTRTRCLKARFGRGLADPDAWVLGEDSGIECEALDGAPGLHSARWAPGLDQADALLARLEGEPERRARMVTELVAALARRRGAPRPRCPRGRARDRAPRHRRVRLRPDLHPRTVIPERSPSSATSGSAGTRTAPGQRRLSRRLWRRASPGAEVEVDLGAEHDQVRHHVEPHEQHRRPRERLQHRVVLRGST